jgi:hypothetical protein
MSLSRTPLRRARRAAAVCVTLAALGILGTKPASAQEPAAPEELTSGPIHEAFGEPVAFDPKPGLIVPKQPPDPIEELPTDQKPEGDNVVWIAGYWFWDDARQDFLWVSGFWRAVPPGRTWIPGYWAALGDGRFQWVNGFWASAQQQEAQYLPEPPASLENGPSTEPPSADVVWAPGCWVWNETRYLWRPGFWVNASPDWVWVPAHYSWSPGGYLFIDGYWDYAPAARGLLFAPVYFPRAALARPNFVFTPSVVIDTNSLVANLFARPGGQHYYFGDYYAAESLKAGIYPAFAFHGSHYGYDPIYSHASWAFGRKDPQWAAWQKEHYQELRAHPEQRPPQTFAAIQALARQPNANRASVALARPLTEVVRQKTTAFQFQKVEPQRVQEFGKHAAEFRTVQRERVKFESSRTAARTTPNVTPRPPAVEPKKVPAPPRVEPRPEPKVEPKRANPEPRVEPKRGTPEPKVEPKYVPHPQPATAHWQMPKPPSVIAPPRAQPQAPAAPQAPPHHAEPPKTAPQPVARPHPEDVLKHPAAPAPAPKAKEPPKPKGKD